MHFEQIYLGCLAQASYLVGDGGECAIVDPRRDVEVYLEAARARGLTIRHIIETHLHADFVSGHCELARRTGATVYVGRAAGAGYEHVPIDEGLELRMGSVVLRFLETPGHTPESVTVLVIDASVSEVPQKMLTGDTLFIGDVGRPDLVGSKGRSAEEMAGLLYDSVHQKLLAYPDEVEVWPAHGAGSACGKNISTELSSTLGDQRRTNLMLQPMEREEFVRLATVGLAAPPLYFPHDAELNRQGAAGLDELPTPPALAPEEVLERQAAGAVVLDCRSAADFGAGHVPGAVNVGLGGQFAFWTGSLLAMDTELVLVAESEECLAEARTRLARVGLEAVVGVLAGGMEAWRAAGLEEGRLPQVEVRELKERLAAEPELAVLDVRRPGEWENARVPGVERVTLAELEAKADSLDPARPTAVICAGGYRSSAAASLLRRRGHEKLWNVTGGTSAWVEAGLEVERG